MELKFAPVFLGYTYSLDVTSLVVFTASVQRDELNILHTKSCLAQDEVPSPQLKRSLER